MVALKTKELVSSAVTISDWNMIDVGKSSMLRILLFLNAKCFLDMDKKYTCKNIGWDEEFK